MATRRGEKTEAPRQRDVRGVVIGVEELRKLRVKLGDLADKLGARTDLAEAIGAQQAASAKRRIGQTKRSPAGRLWAPWSERYAKTRKRQHSLLVSERHLEQSITYDVVGPLEVHVGSNLKYARAHLYGNPARGLPARPYLDTDGGFADSADRSELRDIVRAFLKEGLGL